MCKRIPQTGSSSPARSTRPGHLAFTTLELVGVLAILAILAAFLIPTVIRRIDQTAREREAQDLNTLAQGLAQSIRTERKIPATNAFDTTIANYLALASSQVRTNPRRLERIFLVDPAVSVGGYNPASGPYVQVNTGPTNPPANARVILLSTLARPALTNSALAGISSATFNEIWNTAEGVVPPSLGSRKADDLKIQRLELGSLFHKLRLQNVDTNPAFYTFDTNAPSSVAPLRSSRTVYLLDGTTVNLYMSNSSTLLQLREILTEDRSFVYQNGLWSGNLSTPSISTNLDVFGNTVAQFLNAGWRMNAANGARPQAVIESLYNYMVDYVIWSRGDPDPSHGIPPWQGATESAAPQFPYFRLLNEAQIQVNNVTGDLIKK